MVVSYCIILKHGAKWFHIFISNDKASLQVMQFLESQEYSMFTRIIFDTAPTVSNIYVIRIVLGL